jgi:hypothetical protein
METIMRSSVMELIIGVTIAMGIAVVAASAIGIAVDYYLLDGSRAHSRLNDGRGPYLTWRRPHDPFE